MNFKTACGRYGAALRFAAFFTGFYILLMLGRFCTTAAEVKLIWYQGYHIVCAAVFALVCAMYGYSRRTTGLLLFTSLVWFCAALCKRGSGMVLSEREIVQTVETGVAMYAVCAVIFRLLCYGRGAVCKVLKIIVGVLFALSLLMPLLVSGYYVVSGGHMLSANILLTLFQTDCAEVISYLREQNLPLWAVSVAAVIMFAVAAAVVFGREKPAGGRALMAVNTLLAVYLVFGVFPKLNSSFIINTVIRISDTLKEYSEYDEISALRGERIAKLQKTVKSSAEPQLHVVVMGESTVRGHLSAFGYAQKTTPELDKLVAGGAKHIFLFPQAYSNNIQTVMSVQFALTSQNQYDGLGLKDAWSLTEVASAAGFETYWISNQMHQTTYDTPIKTIADGADHRVYINESSGGKLRTTYYDAELAEYFPAPAEKGKTLLIFHLMGCHNVYNDRYPGQFEKFSASESGRVNTYDNCVLYNDYVLSLLYEKAAADPRFMSFTYLSDHGEDPDKGLTHDYSKFTWNMAHIPFYQVFSDKFAAENPDITAALAANSGKYWTSDLLYNELLHILGISGAPGENKKYDISSDGYGMSRKNLTIIEGTRHISEDNN